MTAVRVPVEAPTEPITEDDCLHCGGAGVVDDDWFVEGHGNVGAEFRCDRCDGEGRAPVDADGRCACDDCLRLPADQRAGNAL